MVALYSPDEVLLSRIAKTLRSGTPINEARSWRELVGYATAAECLLVAIVSLKDDTLFEVLCAFKRRFPYTPVVLITHEEADNLRLLKNLIVEEVVFTSSLEKELHLALGRASTKAYLYLIAEKLERAAHLTCKLRQALVFACRSEQPIRTVADLARHVQRDRSTLCSQWRRTVGRSTCRLEDFLDWLLLLRAAGQKGAGWKWGAVAAQLGVSERTLRRLSVRLCNRTLREFDARGQAEVIAHFEKSLLNPLLCGGREQNDVLSTNPPFCP